MCDVGAQGAGPLDELPLGRPLENDAVKGIGALAD